MNCKWKVKFYIHCLYAIIIVNLPHSFLQGGWEGSAQGGDLSLAQRGGGLASWKLPRDGRPTQLQKLETFMTSLYFFLYYGLDTESVLCVYVEHYTHLLGA